MAVAMNSTALPRRAIPPPYGRLGFVVDLFARDLPRAKAMTSAELDVSASVCGGALETMTATQARSFDETRAKVRVLRLCLDDEPLDLERILQSASATALLVSILRDLERF